MTKYDKPKLSRVQTRAIPVIVAARNVEEGCKALGISRNCYYEWMKLPEFCQEIARLREELVNDAIAQLKANATKAASTLSNLMDREDSPSVQRAAANDVLNHIVKFKEIQEFEKRLNKIEKTLDHRGNL